MDWFLLVFFTTDFADVRDIAGQEGEEFDVFVGQLKDIVKWLNIQGCNDIDILITEIVTSE